MNESVKLPAKPHDPFVLRKKIALSGLGVALLAGLFGSSTLLCMAIYAISVTLFDYLAHYYLGLRSAASVDPAQLLALEGVTPAQFEAYQNSRRAIRMASLGVAFVVSLGVGIIAGIPFGEFLMAFDLSYILATLSGIAYVRLVLNLPSPKLVRRDDRYYVYCRSTAGCTTAADWAASRVGWKTTGPFVG